LTPTINLQLSWPRLKPGEAERISVMTAHILSGFDVGLLKALFLSVRLFAAEVTLIRGLFGWGNDSMSDCSKCPCKKRPFSPLDDVHVEAKNESQNLFIHSSC